MVHNLRKIKYNLTQGTHEVTSFSEVDNFLVPGNIKQMAMTISEKDEEIKAFVTENNINSQADWINRDEGIIKQMAMTISEKDEEIKAFVTENAENNLTSQADWINEHDGIVRLQHTATLLLNETHALYRGLTTYIDVEGEVLHVEKHEETWYAPGLRGALPSTLTVNPSTNSNSHPSTD